MNCSLMDPLTVNISLLQQTAASLLNHTYEIKTKER